MIKYPIFLLWKEKKVAGPSKSIVYFVGLWAKNLEGSVGVYCSPFRKQVKLKHEILELCLSAEDTCMLIMASIIEIVWVKVLIRKQQPPK